MKHDKMLRLVRQLGVPLEESNRGASAKFRIGTLEWNVANESVAYNFRFFQDPKTYASKWFLTGPQVLNHAFDYNAIRLEWVYDAALYCVIEIDRWLRYNMAFMLSCPRLSSRPTVFTAKERPELFGLLIEGLRDDASVKDILYDRLIDVGGDYLSGHLQNLGRPL